MRVGDLVTHEVYDMGIGMIVNIVVDPFDARWYLDIMWEDGVKREEESLCKGVEDESENRATS